MGRFEPADHLVWRTITVAGRKACYGDAGHGLPILFLHGWALGGRSYKRALERLVRFGCRVLAPALPEFGGTAGLPGGRCEVEGYAAWTADFLDAVGVDEPVLAAGHSLGGAVATRLAHDFPHRVGSLVLINSVGGGIWSRAGETVRNLGERPVWDWVLNFSLDVALAKGAARTVASVLEDAVPNVVTNPLGVWRSAVMARQADLTQELKSLPAQGVSVAVLWGEADAIMPRACFDAICEALGATGELVRGRHLWLIADPDAFAAAMIRPVTGAVAARAARVGLAPGLTSGFVGLPPASAG